MKKCIIIDDENRARLLMRNMLAEMCPEINVVDECDDLPSGVKAIKKLKPDLVFLDIEMPGHSGLEILDYFEDEELTFEIIFCTGYSEYALQAFRLSATDYLLKPLDPEMLKAAVQKFLKRNNSDNVVAYRALQENTAKNADTGDKCIVVNLAGSTRFVKVKDIIMLAAEGSYCQLHLSNGEKLLTSKNLKHFEDRLTEIPFFYRCHKSYMINLKKVTEYNKSDNSVMLHDKLNGLVSADKSETFLHKMETLV
jgi:two-component system, LytTR family, response regulator